MPELPDLVVYIDALRAHVVGRVLTRILVPRPFVLRSVDPPLEAIFGSAVRTIDRVGKRIVLGFDGDLFLVIHLMIAGRLKWVPKPPATKILLASFEFEHGRLFFTEASSKKRASMQLVRGGAAVRALDPGGIEPLEATRESFHEALTRENHTVKRALTDPHLFSGIGNAYSDEILHAAQLSPLKLTRSITDEEFGRLHRATRATLMMWIEKLRSDAAGVGPALKSSVASSSSILRRSRISTRNVGWSSNDFISGRVTGFSSASRILSSETAKSGVAATVSAGAAAGARLSDSCPARVVGAGDAGWAFADGDGCPLWAATGAADRIPASTNEALLQTVEHVVVDAERLWPV